MVSKLNKESSDSSGNNSQSISNVNMSKEKRRQCRKIKLRYWMICIAIMILFSGYNCYLSLQSSFHVENGLGAKITTISYALQSAISILLAPFILRLIGPKKSIILAECAYVLYVIANAFSNEVLLVMGAIAASFAEALFWIPVGITMVYFAKKYHIASSIPESICMIEFSGILYSMIEFNQVIGNAVSTLVLNVLNTRPMKEELVFPNISSYPLTTATSPYQNLTMPPTNLTTIGNGTPALPGIDLQEYMYCGANDCQNVEIIDESIDNYVPTNPIAKYVLTGCLLLLMVLGMVSHIILMPEMPFSFFNEAADSEEREKMASLDDKSNKNSIKKIALLSYNATKDTLMQLINPYQFFIVTPYTIYIGIIFGFVITESTRAYASCILGINTVGICIIICAFAASINSMIIGKFFGKWGRVPLIAFEIIYDLSLYMFCLFWKPTESTTWMVYVLFVALGISSNTAAIITTNVYGSEFYKTKEISFNIWSITFAVGLALQNGISTLLCVREKIYIFMAWIVVTGTLQNAYGVHLCLVDSDKQQIEEVRSKKRKRKVEKAI